MDGQQWIDEIRRIRKVLGELGHCVSGTRPMRCQYCRELAGILALHPKPCPRNRKASLLVKG